MLIHSIDSELDPETEATIADELRRNLDLQRRLKALRRVEPAYRKTLDEQRRPELWQREREAPQYDLTGTDLDLRRGDHVSAPVVNTLIKAYQPKFVFCGHAPDGQGKTMVGTSLIVNPAPLARDTTRSSIHKRSRCSSAMCARVQRKDD